LLHFGKLSKGVEGVVGLLFPLKYYIKALLIIIAL